MDKGNEPTKYKKFLNNIKDSRAGNRLIKVLGTTSLADIIQVNKWWEQPVENDEEIEERWKSLEHNAVIFPLKYEPHGVKIRYKGEEIILTPNQEELATFWAQILDNELSSKEITRKNFFKKFKKDMGERYALSNLNDFDFTPIYDHLVKMRERNKNKTPEEKKIEKEKKQKLLDNYGYAIVDGFCEKLSNYG